MMYRSPQRPKTQRSEQGHGMEALLYLCRARHVEKAPEASNKIEDILHEKGPTATDGAT